MKSRLFSIKSIFAVTVILIACLVIWFFGSHIPYVDTFLETKIVRSLLIASIAIVSLLSIVITYFANKRHESNLVAILAKKEKSSEKNTTDLENHKKNIRNIMVSLKKFKIYGKNRHYSLDSVPWYILIGAKGCGKSTIIKNSGLFFPLEYKQTLHSNNETDSDSGYKWWITDQSVFLEISRFMNANHWTDNNHRAAWLSTLQQLKKYKKHPAINGIIVAISAELLLSYNETEINNQIKASKQYLLDIDSYFSTQLPIYIIINKCDMIAGFREYFQNINQTDSHNPLGITFPFKKEIKLEDYFIEKFDELITRLKINTLSVLNQINNTDKSQLANFFPQRLFLLKKPLLNLLKNALRENANTKRPLRGIYFCSAEQTEETYDNLSAILSSTFQIAYPQPPKYNATRKPYFLKNVLTKIIIPEAVIAKNNETNKLKKFCYCATYTFLGIAFLTFTSVIVKSYIQTEYTLSQVNQNIFSYVTAKNYLLKNGNNIDNIIETLLPLESAYIQISNYAKSFPSYLTKLPISTIKANLYHKLDSETATLFFPEIANAILYSLKNYKDEPLSLYRHLLASLDISERGKDSNTEITKILNDYWLHQNPHDPVKIANLNKILIYTLEHKHRKIDVTSSQNFITARAALEKMSPENLVYLALKGKFEQTYKDNLYLSICFDQNQGAQYIFTNTGNCYKISNFYTKKVYNDFYKKNLIKIFAETYKGLNKLSIVKVEINNPKSVTSIIKKVNQIYYADYIKTWKNVQTHYTMSHAETLDKLQRILTYSSKVTSPQRSIINLINKNTTLKSFEKNNPVNFEFREIHQVFIAKDKQPSMINTINSYLLDMSDMVENIRNNLNPSRTAFTKMKQLFTTDQQSSPIIKLRNLADASPEPLKSWLITLTGNTLDVLLSQARDDINSAWNYMIIPEFEQKILHRFPFDKTSKDEVSIEDFTEIFGSNGRLQNFFKEFIAPFVNTSSNIWHRRRIYGYSIGIPASSIDEFKSAQAITNTFFPNNSRQLSIDFLITPLNLDKQSESIQLSINTSPILIYRHGPPNSFKFHWPNGNNNELNLSFYNFNDDHYTESFYGVWSWFRLMDKYQPYPSSALKSYLLSVSINHSNALFSIRIANAQTDLSQLLHIIDQFKLPKNLQIQTGDK